MNLLEVLGQGNGFVSELAVGAKGKKKNGSRQRTHGKSTFAGLRRQKRQRGRKRGAEDKKNKMW